jgi:hypothetical protein
MQYCRSSGSIHVQDMIVEDLPKQPLKRAEQNTSHTDTQNKNIKPVCKINIHVCTK